MCALIWDLLHHQCPNILSYSKNIDIMCCGIYDVTHFHSFFNSNLIFVIKQGKSISHIRLVVGVASFFPTSIFGVEVPRDGM